MVLRRASNICRVDLWLRFCGSRQNSLQSRPEAGGAPKEGRSFPIVARVLRLKAGGDRAGSQANEDAPGYVGSGIEHDERLRRRPKGAGSRAAETGRFRDLLQLSQRVRVAAGCRREHQEGKRGVGENAGAIFLRNKVHGARSSSRRET